MRSSKTDRRRFQSIKQIFVLREYYIIVLKLGRHPLRFQSTILVKVDYLNTKYPYTRHAVHNTLFEEGVTTVYLEKLVIKVGFLILDYRKVGVGTNINIKNNF